MRCPKCGAFIEDGKDSCFMCGTNINTYKGSENDFKSKFPNQNNSFDNKNDYRNVEITAKDGDKDIFDFVQEHKNLTKFILFLIAIVIIFLIGLKYYNSKMKETPKKPVIANLYYEIDNNLTKITDSDNQKYFTKSAGTGVECSIKLDVGSSQSNTHVEDYFKSVVDPKIPTIDENGEVENELDEIVTQQSSMDINGTKWYYTNIFYREQPNGEFTSLKYRYMSVLYNGYFYNIEFFNSNNDISCTASIDAFSRTLEFISTETGE